MIGVLASEEHRDVVREFFELFKTPWEFYEPGGAYEVVLATAPNAPEIDVPLRILFGSTPVADTPETSGARQVAGASLLPDAGRIPLYGSCLVFEAETPELPVDGDAGTAALRRDSDRGTTVRLGYDLFAEIRFLLTEGQPEDNARIPALDRHIELLRSLMLDAGIALVEIPPLPAGHPFAVCLSHDVDHPVLRNHRSDHTALGFLYRATVGSVMNLLRGRMSLRETFKNLCAALRFPLVHLRLARDFWSTFDRYMEIEQGLASTFFVIPRRDDPGMNVPGPMSDRRAAAYTLDEIRPQLDRIRGDGGEIALHGIDAWTDLAQARDERKVIARLAGDPGAEIGVRMHWLCFDRNSPRILAEAGFSYDSTCGYNGTVGYRAGTLQAFQPLGAENLVELPLHIMDTALFYPSHMNLSRPEAAARVGGMIADAARHGGLLTLNWHDRSIAPERQWGGFYSEILNDLRRGNPWFATASQAAAWFRLRRSASFEEVRRDGRVISVKVRTAAAGAGESAEPTALPDLRLRVTRAAESPSNPSPTANPGMRASEETFRGEAEVSLAA